MQIPLVDAVAIQRATAVLHAGGLVALPTETVYGLAADASNEVAMRALFAAKGRPADHPVIVHIDGYDAVKDWARDVPDAAKHLARAFWPGPLTLVLKRTSRASDLVTGGQETVALRAPSHPWMRAVLHQFGGALAAPSANSFGRISPTTAQHVKDDLGEKPRGRIDLILDGGACPIGIESTIVDLSGGTPTLLRPGAILREELQRALGTEVFDAATQAPRTPGRLEKHYAPRTPLSVLAVDQLAMELSVASDTRSPRIAVLAPMHVLQACRATVILAIAAAESSDDYIRLLYTHLHRLDSSGADCLVVARPPSGPEWDAVHDRLRRAEAGAVPC
ncbi:MAG: threonylcarbamoyl-AMP synthase [Burkholderiaceae bacterium]|nr:threonylcarbamoyl-AMP synthase [Burkholderiaceae bacterium]